MKSRIFTLTGTLLLSAAVSAQEINWDEAVSETKTGVNALGQTVITSKPATFRITPPASEWELVDEEALETMEKKEVRNDFQRENRVAFTVLDQLLMNSKTGVLYRAIQDSGLFLAIPIIDTISYVVDVRERT